MRPQLPYVLNVLNFGEKGNKTVYFGIVENENGNIRNIQQKWSNGLNDDILFEYVTKLSNVSRNSLPLYINISINTSSYINAQ